MTNIAATRLGAIVHRMEWVITRGADFLLNLSGVSRDGDVPLDDQVNGGRDIGRDNNLRLLTDIFGWLCRGWAEPLTYIILTLPDSTLAIIEGVLALTVSTVETLGVWVTEPLTESGGAALPDAAAAAHGVGRAILRRLAGWSWIAHPNALEIGALPEPFAASFFLLITIFGEHAGRHFSDLEFFQQRQLVHIPSHYLDVRSFDGNYLVIMSLLVDQHFVGGQLIEEVSLKIIEGGSATTRNHVVQTVTCHAVLEIVVMAAKDYFHL